MNVWDFIQDEIFGMKWLNRLIGSMLSACGLDTESKLGGSLQFFIYDMIKIMVLLGALIFLISYIQSFFPPERTKKILGRRNILWHYSERKRKKRSRKSLVAAAVSSLQVRSHRPVAEKRLTASAASRFSVRAAKPVISSMTTP